MYIIKGLYHDEVAYYVSTGIDPNTTLTVRTFSATIKGAKLYDNLDIAISDCKDLRDNNFKIYPVCPRCHNDYDGYPAISRKDNKTKVCSKCGTQEAMFDFINYIKKNNKS